MKVLVVVSRYPWPPRRGDQMRAHQALAALCGAHEVTLLAPRAAGAPSPPLPLSGLELYRVAPWPGRLAAVFGAAARGAPLQQGLFASRDLARRLASLARQADLVLLQLARLERFVRQVGDRPLLVDLIDSLALNLESRATRDRAAFRPFLREEARRLAGAEERLVRRASRAVLVAERDRAAIVARRSELAGRLAVVPLAVEPPAATSGLSVDSRSARSLVFTGNLGYFPNRDAVGWLLEELWPALRSTHPGLTLRIAGDRPARALRAAARRADGVELVASPPSLSELLASATLALAPLRCGSGAPVKVLEAWAAGVPVVASPWAAAGLGAEAAPALSIATERDEWLAQVGRLLAEPAERERLRVAGRALLVRRHASARVAEAWLEEVDRTCAPHATNAAGAAGVANVAGHPAAHASVGRLK